jgi:hypothetical protein
MEVPDEDAIDIASLEFPVFNFLTLGGARIFDGDLILRFFSPLPWRGFINRGLIDGVNTVIESSTVNPRVTSAPVIAARNGLDIGAGVVNNSEHGLIYSVGDTVRAKNDGKSVTFRFQQ